VTRVRETQTPDYTALCQYIGGVAQNEKLGQLTLKINKKSTHGIKTPQHEIDLIKDRLKRLKEMLQ
jgi:hypothetical protein